MQSLFTAQPTAQVEILDFQTFTTEYVAKRYGTSEANIKEHKREHSDEILENIHFVIEPNRLNRPLIKWTLRGIIKLGMFIRSPQAKNFRLWAEQELEKSINAELENARLTRLKAIEQSNRISSLQMQLATDKKHQLNQINGYKSQIKKHNEQIKLLKAKLTIAENKAKSLSSDDELLKRLEWLFKRSLSDGVIYAINSSRDKIINDALKKANDEFMGNLHLLKEN